jgi:hypothetical protein
LIDRRRNATDDARIADRHAFPIRRKTQQNLALGDLNLRKKGELEH